MPPPSILSSPFLLFRHHFLLQQAVTTKGAIDYLADRYTFRFIGDSTTRRLTESFMSVVTGEGSTHPKVQTRIDFSTGNLKVR